MVFLPKIKYFRYKTENQFSNIPLVVEQKSYETKIVNAFIVYNSDNWPKIIVMSFTLKNFLFGTTNSQKSKWVLRGYGIALWIRSLGFW